MQHRIGNSAAERSTESAAGTYWKMSLSRRIVVAITMLLILMHVGNGVYVEWLWTATALSTDHDRVAKATILAEHASRALGAVDQALDILVDKVGTNPQFGLRSIAIHMLLEEYAAKLPQVRAFTVTDANGTRIYDSRHWPDAKLDLSDRDFFTEQRRWRGANLFIDRLLVNRTDGKPFFALSRPILDSNGNVRGVIAAVAATDYFSSFYTEEQLGFGAAAALARADGAILSISHPEQDSASLVGMTVDDFLAHNAGLIPTSRPVPRLPAQIVVATLPVGATPTFRAFIAADAFMMLVLTILALLMARVLRHEADIRELREEALRQSEQSERLAREDAEAAVQAKSAFLANMSHELRTPLNSIIGFSDIISSEHFGPANPRYVEYGTLIHRSGKHLLDIINDILEIAKMQAGKIALHRDSVDIGYAIDTTVEFLAPQADKKSITIVRDVAAGCPLLEADPVRVRQILLNLVSNAIKFTPDGGTVEITTRLGPGQVITEVRDTGIGMAQDEIPMALEPFGQIDNGLIRQHEGTGLGLPLAKSLVEAHGGDFEIESDLGAGTLVRFSLPIAAASAVAAA